MASELLEFEREALLDILNENSLTISCKGLLNDRLLFHLIQTYSHPCHLVLVIGTNVEEENSILHQLDEQQSKANDENRDGFQRPQQISYASMKSQDRIKLYQGGGVIFISTRILVVDMLTERVPFSSISGIIVYNAHRVLKDCQMSFILRLFRMQNKTGFITALSENASSFLGSLNQLDRCMRTLFAGKLYLWPRYNLSVINSLESKPMPKVQEYRIEMTPMMKQIQFTLMDLISQCIRKMTDMRCFMNSSSFDHLFKAEKDLRTIDGQSINTINVISTNFNKLIHANLDPVWYQMTSTAHRYIRDIRLLKSLTFHLTELDSVTFYGETVHIRESVKESLSSASDWLFWEPAQTLFKLAKERVYGESENGQRKFQIEINPKLDALMDLLKDLEKKIIEEHDEKEKRLDDDELEDNDKIVDIIIVVENRYAITHIERYQDKGRDVVLEELRSKCELLTSGKKIELILKRTKSATNQDDDDNEIINFEEQLTLTQMMGKIEDHEISIMRKHNLFQLHYYDWSADQNCGLGLKHLLTTLRPRYVILYEPEVSCIRRIETYQALYGRTDKPLEVFFFIFDGSAEEQRYLRNLQVEKDSFIKLIQEKSRLPNVRENEGLIGEHPDLVRGKPTLFHPEELQDRSINTRIGGQQNKSQQEKRRMVLVDLREFGSTLPSFIHKIGIDLEPVTLEIGDYLITPECCIERKSITDLIQSLNSGRLYSQAQVMTRHYPKSLLLIEFPDDGKSFNFKSRCWGVSMNSSLSTSNPDARPNPLVQLSVLTIQFPLLRLIWSPSPHFTVDIIDQLKHNKEEPNKDRDIIRLNLDKDQELPLEYVTDRFDIETKEFLLCLPGITTNNVYTVMSQFESIKDICQQSIEELIEKMGSEFHAQLLYGALHSHFVLDQGESQQKQNGSKRFTYVRKRKKILQKVNL